MRKQQSSPADQSGFYLVRLADQSSVEFAAKGLESREDFSGCAFFLHGLSADVTNFVYDVAVAGDMVILNAQGANTHASPTLILTDVSQTKDLPKDMQLTPVLCESGQRLAELLGAGFGKWQNYRNQVIEGQ